MTDKHEQRCFEEQVAPYIGPGVSWFGPADAMAKRQLLARARCLLFPIQWEEPFGMVLVEAMAVGTPVVAMGRGSVPEIVQDSVTGFVATNLQGLVDGLRRVDTIDPAECRRRVQRCFRVDAMAAGYERVYERVLAGRQVTVRPG